MQHNAKASSPTGATFASRVFDRLQKPAKASAVAAALGILGGCVSLPGMQATVAPAQVEQGLQAQQVNVSADAVTYHFDFVFDDAAKSNDSENFGAGYIVVTQEGKEVQAIAHDFALPRSELDSQGWLQFADLNNDGWQDFLVPHRLVGDVLVMSLYEYNNEIGRFVPVEKFNGLGEINRAGAGCVQVTLANTGDANPRENYCYSAQAKQWVPQVSSLPVDAVASADAGCAGATPDFKGCRKARRALDKDLQNELQNYSKARQGMLSDQKNKAYAARFVRNSKVAHQAWLRYRDARCNAYVREQGFDSKLFNSAIESCRYDLSLHQLHQYRARNARMGAGAEVAAVPEAAPVAEPETAVSTAPATTPDTAVTTSDIGSEAPGASATDTPAEAAATTAKE